MPERYWFNLATGRVETDADAGRRSDRMGPYATREAAAHALESARLRTIAWDATGDVPPDGAPAGRWTPPTPSLRRHERWLLRHRTAARVGFALTWAALVLLAVGQVVDGEVSVLTLYLAVVLPLIVMVQWRQLRARARQAGDDSG